MTVLVMMVSVNRDPGDDGDILIPMVMPTGDCDDDGNDGDGDRQ